MNPEFDALEAELESVGLGVTPCGRCRLTVRQPGKPMTARHAPVWVTCVDDQWYVVPWGGHVYSAGDRQAVIDICRKVIEALDTGDSGSVDEKLKQMSLRRLDEQEYAEFGRQLHEAQRVSPPEVSLDDLCERFRRIGFEVQESGDRSARFATTVAGAFTPRELWCTVFGNHWYVRTPGGRVYGCEDEVIVELCFWTLREAEATVDRFSPEFVEGHSMFEVTGRLKEEIESWAVFDVDP